MRLRFDRAPSYLGCFLARGQRVSGLIRHLWIASLVLIFASGCMKSPTARFAEDVEKVRSERNPERLIQAADAFAEVGDLRRAAEYYELAIENGAAETKVLSRLLDVLIQDKQYRSALLRAEQCLRTSPRNYSLQYLIAVLHMALGETEQAREKLELLLENDPENPDAHYSLALLLHENRDLLGADAHFRKYLNLNPKGAYAAEARASLLKGMQ